jgi:hypothetical protein
MNADFVDKTGYFIGFYEKPSHVCYITEEQIQILGSSAAKIPLRLCVLAGKICLL